MRKRLKRWQDAVLVFSALGMSTKGADLAKSAICAGQIKVDGNWTDIFLRAGGLDEALRQHRLLLEDPKINIVDQFWTPNAVDIAVKVADARSEKMAKMFGGDLGEMFEVKRPHPRH